MTISGNTLDPDVHARSNRSGRGDPASSSRKEAILVAACEHFGRYGFRGASLREIANEAGVSLTLLDHHFGNKSGLLSAVIDANRPFLRQRADAVQRLRWNRLGAPEPHELVREWVAIAFEIAERADGLRFLRLVARMIDDAAPEAALVRGQLEDAADGFVDALQARYPRATRRAAHAAYLCVSATLLRFLSSAEPLRADDASGSPAPNAQDRSRLERLLAAGIEAMLASPESETDMADGRSVADAPATCGEATLAAS